MQRPLLFASLILTFSVLAFQCPARAQHDEGAEAPTEPATNLAQVAVEGSADPPGRIEALIESVAPANCENNPAWSGV